MEIPDGIPKWSGHKGQSELLQELTDDPGCVYDACNQVAHFGDWLFLAGLCQSIKGNLHLLGKLRATNLNHQQEICKNPLAYSVLQTQSRSD